MQPRKHEDPRRARKKPDRCSARTEDSRGGDVKRAVLTLLSGAVALAVSTSAHHSFAASYVEDQRVSVEGDVVQFEYRNPHSWVHINARDETGVMRQGGAEWGGAPRL